ncbi:MAG TPA: methyltransferase domain-containing protein [Thiobacillaceae bacterium]|nr:methyltransferase domain-containing protein [Thiobacillaceae bacterium]
MSDTLPRSPDGKRLLHIGCGSIDSPYFVNIDARRLPHVHFLINEILEIRFIPDASFDFVYMSHVLEHVPHQQTVDVLCQIQRILRPGGVCRLSVPDFDHLVSIYQHNDNDLERIIHPLMGGQDYRYNYHYGIFNHKLLSEQFAKAGFVNIRAWSPHDCAHHDFSDTSSLHINIKGKEFPVSLNLEADKP